MIKFDSTASVIKRNLSETATEKQQELYNLISEIGFKSFYMYIFGELIEDILPEDYLKISFEKDEINDNIRKLILEPVGNRFFKTYWG